MPSTARTLTAAALACGVALALPAAAAPGDSSKTSRVDVTEAVTKLVADVDRGSVTIRSGRTAAVDVTKRWQGSEPTVDVKVSKGVLTVTGQCPGLVNGPLVYADSPFSTCATDIVVTLPGSRLDTQVDTYGAVSLAGFAGRHDLASGTGGVTVSRTSGAALSVDTNGGAVSLKDLTADVLDVSVSTGAVAVERVTTKGATKVSANGGPLRLTQVKAASFDLSSGTGNETLSGLTATKAVTVSTNGGDVSLSAVRAATVDVSAGTGSVTSTDLSVSTPLKVSTNGGPVAVRSSKAPSLDVSTGTGDVEVKDVKTAKVLVTTNGGNVTSTGTGAAAFDISSGTGAVTVTTSVAPSLVRVATNSGDVTVTVPRGAYSLVFSTNGGHLVLDGVTPDSRSSRKLDLSSGSADITVRGR